MSLNGITENCLRQSGVRLSSLGNLAKELMSNVEICIERQGITPLLSSESSFLSTTAIVEGAIIAETTDAETFLNITTKRIKDLVFETVGRSPGFLDDIAKAIVKPVQDIVETALKPVKDTITAVQTAVKGFIDDGFALVVGGFNTAAKTITTWIGDGFTLIGEGVKFVQGAVDGLLEGVAAGLNAFGLILKQAFSELMKGFEALMKVTPATLFNLQKELQRLIENEQANLVRSYVKEV